jgi:hypothetical protein
MNIVLHDALLVLKSKDEKNYINSLYSISKFFLSFILRLINDQRTRKEEVVSSLSKEGLKQFYSLMNNSSESIVRKLAAKIICQLGSDSANIQTALCELFNFSSFAGKVNECSL